MPDCECLPRCPFFHDRMENMPATADLLKLSYCRERPDTCARYLLFKALGRDQVPADLFPNRKDRAELILRMAGR